MHKKGRSREEKSAHQKAQHRTKFTTRLNKNLLGKLRRLALKKERHLNELIEEAVESYWELKK